MGQQIYYSKYKVILLILRCFAIDRKYDCQRIYRYFDKTLFYSSRLYEPHNFTKMRIFNFHFFKALHLNGINKFLIDNILNLFKRSHGQTQTRTRTPNTKSTAVTRKRRAAVKKLTATIIAAARSQRNPKSPLTKNDQATRVAATRKK